MIQKTSLFLLVAALLLACGQEQGGDVAEVESADNPLRPVFEPEAKKDDSPKPVDVVKCVPRIDSLPDWAIAKELTVHTPENLYEYNNGAAPKYIAYGFSKLAHIRYKYQGDDLRSVTLDVYDMGDPLGAYGIYSTGHGRDIEVREGWGTEGYLSDTVAVAWKRQVYIHISADENEPALISMTERLMEEVLSSISGQDLKPQILDILPKQGFIPHSDQYIAKDLLGHSFLPGGFLASYRIENIEALLFVTDLKTPKAANEAFDQLLAYEKEWGDILSRDEGSIGAERFWAKDPGLGTGIAARTDRYVAGMWGAQSKTKAEAILGELINKL